MNKLFAILLILVSGCKTSDSLIEKHNNGVFTSSNLFPFKYEQLWGYADFYGNTIISARFEEASLFQYGIGIVKINQLYGYISNTGDWLVKPKYISAEPFYNRYHGIKNKDGTGQKNLIAKVNEGKGDFYIDTDGKTLKKVELSYQQGGCAQIQPGLDKYSIRNEDGTYELTYRYWRITSDTSYSKVLDTTNLELDTIIGLSNEFALIRKDSMYAIYCTEASRGIDIRDNSRFLIPADSTHIISPDFIYEDVKFEEYNGEIKPTAIYKKEGKWGIPGYSEEPTVPFIYVDLINKENSKSFLVEFEEGKYGYISIVIDSNTRSKSVVVEHFKR